VGSAYYGHTTVDGGGFSRCDYPLARRTPFGRDQYSSLHALVFNVRVIGQKGSYDIQRTYANGGRAEQSTAGTLIRKSPFALLLHQPLTNEPFTLHRHHRIDVASFPSPPHDHPTTSSACVRILLADHSDLQRAVIIIVKIILYGRKSHRWGEEGVARPVIRRGRDVTGTGRV